MTRKVPTREQQRRWQQTRRARKAEKKRVFYPALPEDPLVNALIEDGYLAEEASENSAAVNEAFERWAVARLAERKKRQA